VLEKGGAFSMRAHLLLVVPQKSASPLAIVGQPHLTACGSTVRAALHAAGPSADRANPTCTPEIKGQGQHELDKPPLAVEVEAHQNSKPPSFAPAAYTGTYVTICFGSWTVAQRDGPCKC